MIDSQTIEIQELLRSFNCVERFIEKHRGFTNCTIVLFNESSIELGPLFEQVVIAPYYLSGLAEYRHPFFLNSATVQMMRSNEKAAPVVIRRRACFDSNICGCLQRLVTGKFSSDKGDESLIEILNYLGSSGFDTTPLLYIAEASINNSINSNSRKVYDSLLGYSIIHYALEEGKTIEPGLFQNIDKNCKKIARSFYQDTRRFPENMQSAMPRFWLIKNMIAKAVLLEHTKENFKEKTEAFIEFINSELLICLPYETSLCIQFFKGNQQVQKFFGKVNKSAIRTASKTIETVRSMAWDLYHLRLLSTWMAQDCNSRNLEFVLPFILSADDGLWRVISANPIKRIALDRGEAYLLNEYNLEDVCSKNYLDKLTGLFEFRNTFASYIDQRRLGEKLEQEINRTFS